MDTKQLERADGESGRAWYDRLRDLRDALKPLLREAKTAASTEINRSAMADELAAAEKKHGAGTPAHVSAVMAIAERHRGQDGISPDFVEEVTT